MVDVLPVVYHVRATSVILQSHNLLTAAADGNEGGRHHLITAAVGNGNLYVMKVQIGDKRWFKGARKDAEGAWNSFTVA